jgi:hypothetical protein
MPFRFHLILRKESAQSGPPFCAKRAAPLANPLISLRQGTMRKCAAPSAAKRGEVLVLQGFAGAGSKCAKWHPYGAALRARAERAMLPIGFGADSQINGIYTNCRALIIGPRARLPQQPYLTQPYCGDCL